MQHYLCWIAGLFLRPRLWIGYRLQQTQLAGTCDRFGAPLDLEFAKDFPIVSFHRIQGEKKPLADLLIGEALRHELEDFYLAVAQWIEKRLGRRLRQCVFALLLLSFIDSQQLPDIVRHHPNSHGLGQEVSHRPPFVDKQTDEATRLGQRQHVNEQMYRFVLFAMCLESDCLQPQHLEPFILPPLCLHLLAPGREHRQCCRRVALGQVDVGLAEGEFVQMRQMSGCRHMALVQQQKHLRGSNLRDAMHEVLLARGPIRLSEQSGRACRISLGQFQAGKQHLTGNDSVGVLYLLPQVEGLLPVRQSSIQVVPFVEDTGQAKMRFAGRRPATARQPVARFP